MPDTIIGLACLTVATISWLSGFLAGRLYPIKDKRHAPHR